jgi:hypothetical protein
MPPTAGSGRIGDVVGNVRLGRAVAHVLGQDRQRCPGTGHLLCENLLYSVKAPGWRRARNGPARSAAPPPAAGPQLPEVTVSQLRCLVADAPRPRGATRRAPRCTCRTLRRARPSIAPAAAPHRFLTLTRRRTSTAGYAAPSCVQPARPSSRRSSRAASMATGRDTARTRPARRPDEFPGDDERRHETFAQVIAGPPPAPASYECVALPSELLGRDESR